MTNTDLRERIAGALYEYETDQSDWGSGEVDDDDAGFYYARAEVVLRVLAEHDQPNSSGYNGLTFTDELGNYDGIRKHREGTARAERQEDE